ncbi:hypothetical protein [Mycetocola saprophilus]|uniref:hypothetical protein n=1 Tax=Mycetocola saprophilus TaxID=76636 RepID=UPI003BF08A2F
MDESSAFNDLGRALYRLLSAGDTRAEYSLSLIRGTGYSVIRVFTPNGEFERGGERYTTVSSSLDLVTAARNLRAACYRAGTGTWFSAVFTVTSQGAATAEYNYDEEPDWGAPIDAALYANDQDIFPRDETAQPDWLKQKIAEGRAQIIAQKNRTRRR